MITVTDGPIIAVAGKEANIYDAATVDFILETLASTGDGSILAIFIDAGGDELVRFRAQEFALTDFDTKSTSTTNAITLAITEAEAVLVDYLETLNPTAGFTT